jgi:hypothetical protein
MLLNMVKQKQVEERDCSLVIPVDCCNNQLADGWSFVSIPHTARLLDSSHTSLHAAGWCVAFASPPKPKEK